MTDRKADRPVESVWDYPRPPLLVRDDRAARVENAGDVLADAPWCHAVKETSHPPCIYIAPQFIRTDLFDSVPHRTVCEFKGEATYWRHRATGVVVAWTYPDPVAAFRPIAGHFCFYASRVDRCTLGGIVAVAQDGDFYGGWITPDVTGPFKGGPGTFGW